VDGNSLPKRVKKNSSGRVFTPAERHLNFHLIVVVQEGDRQVAAASVLAKNMDDMIMI
jgi:ribonuclease HII